MPESLAVQSLLPKATLPAAASKRANALALKITRALREAKDAGGRSGLVQNLLQEYALSSQEGVALMCLAEALLRIPDMPTRDALIRDKIAHGQWHAHLGNSSSLFVNAATWGLLITGKLAATHSEKGMFASLGRLINTGGEPLIRKGVDMAMRMMGEQFVTGQTIDEALKNSKVLEQQGFRYSYDMLGEAALTAHDARRYLQDYEAAIQAIGKASAGRGIYEGPGISIKLSALHPRYSRAQQERVMAELYPILVRLCALAKRYDIGLNIDAEETDRLELSLDLLERLCFEPQLQGWNGLGFVIQAYQKRCPFVIDHVIELAKRSQRRLMIRLVKGAYWDTEIKRAQVDGQRGYPVYTRKPFTDVSYLACASKLLAAPEQVFPQFATHNAHTLAAIHEMADPQKYHPRQYEFQCLHGMGEPLYAQVVGDVAAGKLGRSCRIYAPVGTHETLLAYLVRRLLENGANTSFVNQIADASIALEDLVRDPVEVVQAWAQAEGQVGLPHPAIPAPSQIYAGHRENSVGLDLSNEAELTLLQAELLKSAQEAWAAAPAIDGIADRADASEPVLNPANRSDVVGQVRNANTQEALLAVQYAVQGAQHWASVSAQARAHTLKTAADRFEEAMPRLMGLLIREAGKSAANAIAEVRETVDFLRFYAAEVEAQFDNRTHKPLGPVVCISPWNFPLAIFIGQVSAALAAGNSVIAKPAEQTPLIAAEAVRMLHAAGVPRDVLQLTPGDGAQVGATLVADARVQGVLFTGSTEVARIIQKKLVGRTGPTGKPVPLIAETGGQNAMIVDSSALVEQVVQDVVSSAFDSAGQRCSALRVLCLQDDIADTVLAMLLGAMAELNVGDPSLLSTDVGPVIDEEARANIVAHIESMRGKGFQVTQVSGHCQGNLMAGTYVVPTVIEIDGIRSLGREVFGPVLHVVRYAREALEALIRDINETGYGLTLGLHTRINETIERVVTSAVAGNKYVNRNMVGAVVGVQPFGGEGLSGTGPKAGGPLYLYRLLSERPDAALHQLIAPAKRESDPARERLLGDLFALAKARGSDLSQARDALPNGVTLAKAVSLPGPTGESNEYTLSPRENVLCIASTEQELLTQLYAVVALGGRCTWPSRWKTLREALPEHVRRLVDVRDDWRTGTGGIDVALVHGSQEELADVQSKLVAQEGPVVSVERMERGCLRIPLERLVTEHAVSINTAAAGGNASLMTLA